MKVQLSNFGKLNSIVAAIESDILAEISDVVSDPAAVNKFETVTNKLIERFSDFDDKKSTYY